MGSEISHNLKDKPSVDEVDYSKSIYSAGMTSRSSAITSKSADTVETNNCSPKSMSPKSTSPKSTSIHHRKTSSILMVNNGITGKYISSRICNIAAKFWQQNIDSLSVTDQLEIGVSIFFSMLSTNPEMKRIMHLNLKDDKKIETVSLRYLGMMGWLIRHLITDHINLYELLIKLGSFHQRMGINIQHFNPMLSAINETFSYYFGSKYDIAVKYAMEEIFSFTAKIMTGQDLKIWGSSHMNLMSDLSFLKDLDICLSSSIGKDYLFRYLTQTWCDEIVIFLKSLFRFKKCMSHQQRFIIARDITKVSIQSSAAFCLNLSYQTRANALNAMNVLEEKWAGTKQLEISTDFFAEVEMEIYKLIIDNQWNKFVKEIETLQSNSFSKSDQF